MRCGQRFSRIRQSCGWVLS